MAEVECEARERGAVRSFDLVQQSPSSQPRYPGRMNEMRGKGHVARKGALVEQENAVPLAGQQHRGRGACAAGANDNDIVCWTALRTHPGPPLLKSALRYINT